MSSTTTAVSRHHRSMEVTPRKRRRNSRARRQQLPITQMSGNLGPIRSQTDNQLCIAGINAISLQSPDRDDFYSRKIPKGVKEIREAEFMQSVVVSKTPTKRRETASVNKGRSPPSRMQRMSGKRNRTERFRRGLHASRVARKATNSKSTNPSVPSLKTDLALSKLAYNKQAVILSETQAEVSSMKAKLSALSQELECPICKEPLVRPSALYPCGHIFCSSCLLQTFITPQTHEDPETTPASRAKNCPDCRTSIHTPPVPIYLAKSILALLHPDMGETDNGFGRDLGLGLGLREGEDPWSVLFPDEYTDADAATLTSDSEFDHPPGWLPAPLRPIVFPGDLESEDSTQRARHILARARRGLDGLFADTVSESTTETETETETSDGDTSTGTGTSAETNIPVIERMHVDQGQEDETMEIDDSESESDASQVAAQLSSTFRTQTDQNTLMARYREINRALSSLPNANTRWVRRQPEPPHRPGSRNVRIPPLMRRGVRTAMSERYRISYTDTSGICLSLPPNQIFLGWNIELLDTDRNGEGYMDYIGWEMRVHPERWDVRHSSRRQRWDAYRLKPVPVDEEDEELPFANVEDAAWI